MNLHGYRDNITSMYFSENSNVNIKETVTDEVSKYGQDCCCTRKEHNNYPCQKGNNYKLYMSTHAPIVCIDFKL